MTLNVESLDDKQKEALKKLCNSGCKIGFVAKSECDTFDPLKPIILNNAKITKIRKIGMLWWRKTIATIEFDEMENK